MRKRIHKIIKHPLISGSAILVIGSTVANLFNYIFNLGMGRLLTVSEYGVLASLISIINIFSVFSYTITTVFAKFSASYIGQKKENLIGILLKKGSVLVGVIGFVIAIFIIFSGTQISNFLHIKDVVLIDLSSIALFFIFLSAVTGGIIQGLLKFISSSLIYISSSLLKLIVGIILVLLGFRVFGAVIGIVLSTFLGFFFLLIPLRRFLRKTEDKNLTIPNLNRQLSSYAFPVFLSGLGMTMITSMDIILVKHFFQEVTAGQYAALSLMGRSIFFVVSPIILVFFPLIAQKKEKKEDLLETILLAIVLIGVPSIILSGIYFFFPNIVLNIFFPAKAYASLAPYLGLFSVFVILYTFSFFLNSYYLSIGKTKAYLFTSMATILEIFSIIIFHRSIFQVVMVLIVISFLLLLSLLLYYPNKNMGKI